MTRARMLVVVGGGGVAGLTTALALAPMPVRLLCRAHSQRLFEAALSRTYNLVAHYRTDAVMPA